MQDRIIENAKDYFPFVTKHAVEFIPDDRMSVIMKLDSGESFVYDDYDKTIRRLPTDSGTMTELEVRREFCFRVRKIMMLKRITQTELSQMTGISQPVLNNYLSCKTTPGFYAVDKIAKALKCSMDEFRYTK
jgi:DNA-binding Xre family transcriptional regulator